MKFKVLLAVAILNGFCIFNSAGFQPMKTTSKRLDRFWVPKTSNGFRPIHSVKSPYRRDSYTNTDNDTDTDTDDSSTDTSGKQNQGDKDKVTIPQVNFYSSIPNAMGVVGQGILMLRELSAALGTPLPLWIFSLPMFLLGVALMFLPDLTTLGLPLFYPNGAGENDPLAAFPPLIDFSELKNLDLIQKLLPPALISMRKG